MPFRRFFAKRGFAHPTIYSNALLALIMTMLVGVGVVFSVQASQRSQRASEAVLREQIEEQVRAQAQARMAACTVVQKINRAYVAEPPVTEAGKNVAQAWADLSRVFRCEKG